MKYKARYGHGLLALAGFVLTLRIFYPGVMTNDSVAQYSQALKFQFDDWHPPMMAFIWAAVNLAVHGPSGMLALNAGLYWGGLFLLARELRERGQAYGSTVIAVGFMPFLLGTLGHIWKDTLHATVWVFAVGLLVRHRAEERRGARLWWAAVLLLVGTLVRVNALFGLPSLTWLWLRNRGMTSVRRLSVGIVASAVACVVGGGLFNYVLLHSHKSNSYQSLMVFDLGGISHYTGTDLFGKAWGPEQSRRIVDECYNALAWDVYEWGQCSFAGNRLVNDGDWDASRVGKPWLHAVLTHPLAYLKHRTAYFYTFLTHPQAVLVGRMEKNPWGYEFHPNRLFRTLQRATDSTESWFVFKPWFWLAASLALSALAAFGPEGRERDAALALGSSGFLYLAAYFFVGVASDFRYAYWTIMATCVGAVFAAAQWRRSAANHAAPRSPSCTRRAP